MSSSDDDTWRSYVDADARVVEARKRLEATGDVGPVRRALVTGPADEFRVAVDFITRNRPQRLIRTSLDVLARLAIEGGVEQGAIREVLRTAPPAEVLAVLPALCDEVIRGAHDPYLEFAGLLSLLEEFGAWELMGEALAQAQASPDPEVRELAEGYLGAMPAKRHPRPVTAASQNAAGESQTASGASQTASGALPGAAEDAWHTYLQAWYRLATARHALLEADWRLGFVNAARVPRWRRAVASVLTGVLAPESTDELAATVAAVDPPVWTELRQLVTEEILTDPRYRVDQYLAWLSTLTALDDNEGLAEAIEAGKLTDDPKVQAVAHTYLNGS